MKRVMLSSDSDKDDNDRTNKDGMDSDEKEEEDLMVRYKATCEDILQGW